MSTRTKFKQFPASCLRGRSGAARRPARGQGRSRSLPVDPGDLVVLAVGVVVALLGPAHLVAGEQHRDSLRQEQRREEVALLPLPQRDYRAAPRRALGAAVPRPVVVTAVPVVLTVGLVVLVIVGDQVVQGEAVVGGDEVDRRHRAPGVTGVQIAGAGQPGRELAQRGGLAAPEIPRRIPVLAVPLAPQRREIADLVASLADIPGLGYELDLGHHRILLDQVEERR